jgi:hypothetical protein
MTVAAGKLAIIKDSVGERAGRIRRGPIAQRHGAPTVVPSTLNCTEAVECGAHFVYRRKPGELVVEFARASARGDYVIKRELTLSMHGDTECRGVTANFSADLSFM